MAGERSRTTDTARVEAFSDGVIAIALTLLVLDLIVDHAPGQYFEGLRDEAPTYLAYLTAFLTIASIWLSHHDAFSRLARVDPTIRILNLGLLLGVALVPWPTALLAGALGETGEDRLVDGRAAVLVYVIVSLIVSVAWTAMSTAIVHRPALLGDPADVSWMRLNARLSLASGGIAVVGGVLGWFEPVLALVVFLVVPAAFFGVTLLVARRRLPEEQSAADGSITP